VPLWIYRTDKVHVPAQRHRAIEPHIFRGETDIPLCLDLFDGHAMPEHAHVAAVLVNEAQEDAYRRGFSSAVGTDQSHDLSRRNLQIDVVEREVLIALGHVFEFDGEVRHDFSFSVMVSLASRSRLASSLGLSPSRADNRAACSRCFWSSSSWIRNPRPGFCAT